MTQNTPNFAIPYPEITDYVKDGATAMENIAERVDDVFMAFGQGRNRLINGDFRIAQRGTSFVAGANNDDTYNLDRWTLLSDGNDIVDVTQSTVAPTGGLYSIGLDVETANKKFGIAQYIEQLNCVGIQDKKCTLSFSARTSGSSITNVKAAILSWTGTADAVTSDVVSAWNADGITPTFATNWTAENTSTNVNPTNSWQRFSITATMDTASIKNVAVFIWCDDLTTTLGDFLYITDVQFEVGDMATPFERRHITTELELCQRYYYRFPSGNIYTTHAIGITQSTTSSLFFVQYPVQMRAAADGVEYSAVRMSDGYSGGSAITGISLDYPSPRGTALYCTHGAFSSASKPAMLQNDNNANGYVGFKAEL